MLQCNWLINEMIHLKPREKQTIYTTKEPSYKTNPKFLFNIKLTPNNIPLRIEVQHQISAHVTCLFIVILDLTFFPFGVGITNKIC